MPDQASLERRLATIESILLTMGKSSTIDLATRQTDDANFMALYSIVRELANRAGVSDELFLRHYDARFRWWHDYFLRRVEDRDPERAAEIDYRTLEQASTETSFRSIFDLSP